MKSIAINVNYKGVDYISDYSSFGEKEESALNEIASGVAKGELTYLTFESENKTYHFPASILSESIISVVYNMTLKH